MTHMQRYMCSRFFIDYKTLREQLYNIAQYIGTHYLPSSITTNFYTANNSAEISSIYPYLERQLRTFRHESEPMDQIDLINAPLCLTFLNHLRQVIHQSTVCLTHEDRELLLYNVHLLQNTYLLEYSRYFQHENPHFHKYPRYSSSNSSRSVSLGMEMIYVPLWNVPFQSSPSSLSSKSYGSYRSHPPRNHRYPPHNSYNQSRTYSHSHGNYRQRPS